MTELSFLLDLLLNHKLPKATKEAVAQRLKMMATTEVVIPKSGTGTFEYRGVNGPTIGPQQAPSTLAAMARHGDLVVAAPQEPPAEPVPVAVVAQTAATIAALNARQTAIASANSAGPFSGKPEKGRTSPRKF